MSASDRTQAPEVQRRYVQAAHEVYMIVEEAVQTALTHNKSVRIICDLPYEVAMQLPPGSAPDIKLLVDIVIKFDGAVDGLEAVGKQN